MGLLGFLKKAADVVTTPFAAAGSLVGNAVGIVGDGAGQVLFKSGEDLLHAVTFGQVGSWKNPFDFNTTQLFEAGAIGSKLGEFAGGFSAKFLLPGGLATGLLFGGLSLTNGWVDDHVATPVLTEEAKLFGLTGGSAGDQAVKFEAICGPSGTAPDGTPVQAIAVPLAPGETPTGPTKTDPNNGQVYQLVVVPAGACNADPGKPGVVTVTPAELQQTAGMANALSNASSGSSSGN
jgi:hypothetical protein